MFTEQSYAEKSTWSHLSPTQADLDAEAEALDSGSFTVTFENGGSQARDVHWLSADGKLVLQGSLGPRASFNINTYSMHTFVFTAKGSTEPLPGGKVVVEQGKRLYKYSL